MSRDTKQHISLYNFIIRPFVKKMDLEQASEIGLKYFRFIGRIPFMRSINRWMYGNKPKGLQRELFGLDFYNPIGLGAGLDKHCELYNDLNNLGFSFVEVGPLGADGVRQASINIRKDPPFDILAACIDRDYLTAFTLGYDFFDFFVLDFSTDPNTDILDSVLESRLTEQNYKPIVLKLSGDTSSKDLERLTDFCLMNNIDGIELRSLDQVKKVHEYSSGKLPIIANCHIDTPLQASEALAAGAALVEIRTGLLREGPGIVQQTLDHLSRNRKKTKDNGSTI